MVLAPIMLERLQLHMTRQFSFDATTLRLPGTMLDRLQDMAIWGLIGSGFCQRHHRGRGTEQCGRRRLGQFIQTAGARHQSAQPADRFCRLFTKDKLAEVGKMLLIVIVLSIIGTTYMAMTMQPVAAMVMQPSVAALKYLSDWLTTGMGLMLLLMLLVAALIDVPLQKFLHKSRLKMLHQLIQAGAQGIRRQSAHQGTPAPAPARTLAKRKRSAAVPKADFASRA